jgi:adenylate kinase
MFCSSSSILYILAFLVLAVVAYWYFVRKSGPQDSKVIYTFLGAPGSGKGTLAEQAVDKFGFLKLSTGDAIRENIAKGTELGKKVQEYSLKGQLVPDDIVTGIVKNWLHDHAGENKPIILDGFPRTATQAALLIDMMKKDFSDHVLRVVELTISDDEVVRRISNRLVCNNKQCQAIYTASQFAGQENPKCPKCGSELIKREDDREEVVRERLNVYAQTSKDLIDYYKNAGLKIEQINVGGQEKDQVFQTFSNMR